MNLLLESKDLPVQTQLVMDLNLGKGGQLVRVYILSKSRQLIQ